MSLVMKIFVLVVRDFPLHWALAWRNTAHFQVVKHLFTLYVCLFWLVCVIKLLMCLCCSCSIISVFHQLCVTEPVFLYLRPPVLISFNGFLIPVSGFPLFPLFVHRITLACSVDYLLDHDLDFSACLSLNKAFNCTCICLIATWYMTLVWFWTPVLTYNVGYVDAFTCQVLYN